MEHADIRAVGASEEKIIGSLTFHNFAILIAAACSFIAILVSFYLIWMHALHYTKPYEQRQQVPPDISPHHLRL